MTSQIVKAHKVQNIQSLLLFIAMIFALTGCTAGDNVEMTSINTGLHCVDDSPHCISHRRETLKLLVSDPQRTWIQQKPDVLAYASGVRLFAFKTKKKELSCPELQAGRVEADGAPVALRSQGHSLSTAQISRGIILANEIGRELTKEYNSRCKKT